MTGRARANGEGSIFPYRNGYAAYCWVHTPDGRRKKKWVYGKTRDEVHDKWIKLQSRRATAPSRPLRRLWRSTSPTGSTRSSNRTAHP
jgi:hypothetical protein